jgi:hypothetical protein
MSENTVSCLFLPYKSKTNFIIKKEMLPLEFID